MSDEKVAIPAILNYLENEKSASNATSSSHNIPSTPIFETSVDYLTINEQERRSGFYRTNGCESCDPGFHLTLHNHGLECQKNLCSCSFGNSATGAACSVHQTEICDSCYLGYYLDDNDNVCKLKECVCEHGEGATGIACPFHGNQYCTSCEASASYELDQYGFMKLLTIDEIFKYGNGGKTEQNIQDRQKFITNHEETLWEMIFVALSNFYSPVFSLEYMRELSINKTIGQNEYNWLIYSSSNAEIIFKGLIQGKHRGRKVKRKGN